MQVPFVDLQAQYRKYKDELDLAIRTVLTDGHFVNGKEVELFETKFASYLNVPYCVTVNSGTDALILGIRALSLAPGDEVIVPVHTFIATALAASENRLRPVFVDADLTDGGMDIEDLRRKISAKTKVIIAVHLYGQAEKIDEIKKVIKDSGHKIYLVEDACQAHGAYYKGKSVGSFGIFSAYSFYPGKNLGAYGDGGAIVTGNKEFAGRVRMLRQYGQKKKYEHESIGINSRMDTVQAAVLLVKLKHLDNWNSLRQQWAEYYTQELNRRTSFVTTPTVIDGRLSVFHLYVAQVPKRDALTKALLKNNIQALIHYPIPLHLQAAYASLGYKKGDFPNAERRAKRIISLPLYPELTRSQADHVVDSIYTFYDNK